VIRNIKKYIKSAKIEKEILCDIMNEIDNLKHHSNEKEEENINEVDLETVEEEEELKRKKKKRSIQEIHQQSENHQFKGGNQKKGYESIIQYFSSFYIDSTFYSLGFRRKIDREREKVDDFHFFFFNSI